MVKKNFKWDAQAERALELMEHGNDHVFITGQAGTGKSTLLEHFRRTTNKNIVVLAPTGVAAANVGGRTIHSFCGIGPSSNMNKANKLNPNDPHKEVVQHLDMVIIDEASMVRADLMDYFDKFLRANTNEPKRAFGGVQIVLVGDLYQLSPVVTQNETQMFTKTYPTPYFFSANIFQQISFKFVELDVVHRQKDRKFLKLLQSIRVNSANREELKEINSRLVDQDANDIEDFTVYLSTTNAIAERVNGYKLSQVDGEVKTFNGIFTGKSDGFQPPAEKELKLKVGAQVMMLNNEKTGKWVNGTVGKFLGVYKQTKKELEKEMRGSGAENGAKNIEDLLMVELEDGTTQYIPRNRWDIVDFVWDEQDNAVESDVVGTYSQYPVKLAWAITIHKSQGKTFDNVVIDLGRGAFAHGQLYVALSRCRTLEGIELIREASMGDIKMDARVVEFLDICRKFGERNVMFGGGGLF